MRRHRVRQLSIAAMSMLLAGQMLAGPPASAQYSQDDAGTGADAGDAFAAATELAPRGSYRGQLDRAWGDRDDFYRFTVAPRESLSVLVTVSRSMGEPITLLDPLGVPVDTGVPVLFTGAGVSNALTASPYSGAESYGVRLAVHHAPVGGDYRLHLQAHDIPVTSYSLCFMNCEQPQMTPIQFVFGGSLRSAYTKVLLVPPAHGDLGNPSGPTVVDYLDATLRGMHRWVDALRDFAADHLEFAYLDDITVDIEIFDGVEPADPAGYDVVVGYVAAGPVFRGVASDQGWWTQDIVRGVFGDDVHYDGRLIALSLFGGSPRAGQVSYDYPEVNDLEVVTMHEFAHTFGLGHTLTWDAELGPDLMNSPATFIYGDGWAAGDGGERTALDCISSLDLYGMAVLYRWLPSGTWQPTYDAVSLPSTMPYTTYC